MTTDLKQPYSENLSVSISITLKKSCLMSFHIGSLLGLQKSTSRDNLKKNLNQLKDN